MINRARPGPWKIGLCAGLMIFPAVHCNRAAPAAVRNVPLPEKSSGVFIGIEKFSHDQSLPNVLYAVNDAVDLAYSLSIERGLLPSNRVLLLLAGEPSGESQNRLTILLANGAKKESARQADIYLLVLVQSRLVGPGGLFVLSVATHGYSDGEEQLLMAEDSLLQFRTGITSGRLLQATQTSPESLRLLFVDACRIEFLRGTEREPRSAVPVKLVETLATPSGYGVFSAASVGQSARSGARNGLFTGAVLDGLRCEASDHGKRIKLTELVGFVTAEVGKRSNHLQQPEWRSGGGSVDFILPPCSGRPIGPEPIVVPLEVLQTIQGAASYAAVGGPDNFERSFWLYRQAFQDLPVDSLASLNQGLVARARKLEENSQRAEGIRIYQQLLDPLLAQSRSTLN